MNVSLRILTIACITFYSLIAVDAVLAECPAILPIKPIVPIQCQDLQPQCVCEVSGECVFNWVCLLHTDLDDSNTSSDFKVGAKTIFD